MVTSDEAVRRYLRAIRDPGSVKADTSELDRRLEESDDPVERLQLHAEKARMVDPMPAIEQDFITHAKAWAEAHGVSAEAFRAEGVPPRIIKQAGLDDTRRRPRRRAAAPAKQRVTSEEVRQQLPPPGETFTITSLRDATGASLATARKTVTTLLEEGAVEEVGPDPEATGPGRAATLYRRVG